MKKKSHGVRITSRTVLIGCAILLTGLIFSSNNAGPSVQAAIEKIQTSPNLSTVIYLPIILKGSNFSPQYVLVGWNDLGMHCYNRSFQDLAVLPPYNNLWAQVIQRGDPPKIVTQNITVEYSFPDNTYSVGKSNFWDYAEPLFGVALAPNIGLTGNGLAGTMDVSSDHFVADGIPLTEFSDSNIAIAEPYQLANLVAKNTTTGMVLASLTVVAPVSTEMRCDNCHFDGQMEGIATGRVETNILTLHDLENLEDYPAGNNTPLMNRRPVLCAECHSSNALGKPGVSGIPSLSNAMHAKHAEEMPNTQTSCYNCHPGPTTQCLRDVMSTEYDMDCIDCHGGLSMVASNASPWLIEPKCTTCHENVTQDQALYRNSKDHGGIYCAACHDSPHAIATSRESNDAIKFIQLQGSDGTLTKCTVCHLTQPTGPGPHEN